MKKRDRLHIYKSKLHILATIFFIFLPFVLIGLFFNLSAATLLNFFWSISPSLLRILVAYIISLILGGALAVIFATRGRSDIVLPIFDVLQSFPTFAVLPIAVSVWGANNLTIITFLILAIIWPIFFSTVSSLKLVRHDFEEAVELFGINGTLYFKKFLLPISLPGLITGSIIGLGDGWEALIATEIIVGIHNGLGPFFELYKQDKVATTFGILGFLLIVFTINKLVWTPLLDWSHLKVTD